MIGSEDFIKRYFENNGRSVLKIEPVRFQTAGMVQVPDVCYYGRVLCAGGSTFQYTADSLPGGNSNTLFQYSPAYHMFFCSITSMTSYNLDFVGYKITLKPLAN